MRRQAVLTQTMSRRQLLSAAAMTAAGAVALGVAGCDPTVLRRVHQIDARRDPRHAAWVWQFSIDGPAHEIAATLASYGLAAIVKTHDGVEWMGTYDPAPEAIHGPAAVSAAARTFEDAGVPFHAWAVVKGVDPAAEARMAADVLDAGARTLTLDLEESENFWTGTRDDALRFGEELRALQPHARIDISIDPRPWKLHHIPLHEFVAFTDGIRPQLYWDLFDDGDHVNAWQYFGQSPAEGAVTPRFLVDATADLLTPLDRWLLPVASGDAGAAAFSSFRRRSWERGMPEVSVWRYGTVATAVLELLAAHPPASEPPVA